MAKIDGIKIVNFRALKEVQFGKLWNNQGQQPLTPLTVVIGKNGAGKSTLFDAFGFLADCLKVGVEEACDLSGRGGYERIHTKGTEGPIEFEIYYREEGKARPITYEVAIDIDSRKRPFVKRERLRQRRKSQKYGRPFSFLMLNEGKGIVWKGEAGRQIKEDEDISDLSELIHEVETSEEKNETESVEMDDIRRLGIATLGSLKQHPRISALRKFIEGWYLSYFTPDAARSLPLSGPQKRLSIHGENLGNVVQYIEREHPKKFKSILKRISERIPGVQDIKTEKSPDDRLLLCFNDRGFTDPFYSQQMSDGTLKMFAYLILLEDPNPPPFLCIEEPENGLYHRLLDVLAKELREHATGLKNKPQVFVTTHQPYFVDALSPEEVWILQKDNNGFSELRRASDDLMIKNMVDEGLPLGSLWYSEYLDGDNENAL